MTKYNKGIRLGVMSKILKAPVKCIQVHRVGKVISTRDVMIRYGDLGTDPSATSRHPIIMGHLMKNHHEGNEI